MKQTCLLILLLFGIAWAQAQTRTISGTVIGSDDGQPVIGASVLVVGTSLGTITDLDGKFTIPNVPSSAKQIQVSYIGMQSKTVEIAPNMTVRLDADVALLDEVIVVSYGTAKKASFTGSATVIKTDKLESRPITTISKALDGQVAGLQATSGGGQPGSSSSVVIRGFGSINASNNPLYVVDGIPFDGSLSSINPSDIESMTVLKDASASALYGSRGANGVIMITTKKGREGKTSVSMRATVGWASRAIEPYDLVDQRDFAQLTYESLRNGYHFTNGYSWETAGAMASRNLSESLGGEQYNPFKNYTWETLIDPSTGLIHPDAKSAYYDTWMDAIQKNKALRHEYQFSVQGGRDNTTYLLSLGYLNEDGILVTTGFQRYSARASVDSKVNPWFKASLNTSLSTSKQNFSDYSGSSTSNVWYTAQFMAPIYTTYLKDDKGNNLLDASGRKQLDYGDITKRPVADDFNALGGLIDDIADNTNDNVTLRANMTFGSDADNAKWAKGLKFALNFGMDYRTQNQKSYMNMYHGNQAAAGGLLRKYNTRMYSYTFNQLLTLDRKFDLHHIDALAAHEFYAYQYAYLTAAKTNLVDGILELRPGTTLNDADSYTNNLRTESYFGRLNYDYADKYYLSASWRTDGSSRFHKDYRWGSFWSLGGNWRMSEEPFMKTIDWINKLSVKASYGMQGNDNISKLYAWQSLYNLSWSNDTNIGAMISSLENKNLTWEKSGNLNFGFEASLLDNKLTLEAEYYIRTTTDMLLNNPMALSTGFGSYSANVGDMRNSGLEFQIKATPIKTNDLTWNLTFVGSTLKNEVIKLTDDAPEIISGVYIIKEGLPINSFYMVKSAGVDPATGAELYWSFKKDGKDVEPYRTSTTSLASTSKYVLGSRIPDLFGSIATDITYKGFDFNILTTYSIGGKIYDALYYQAMNPMYIANTFSTHALRRWQKPGDITDVPRVTIGGSQLVTDRYLVDASYFAIKNITLGYNLPKKWTKSAGLESLRIFGSADNIALFKHLNGMDPQFNFSGSTDYVYTPNKAYVLGLEIKF